MTSHEVPTNVIRVAFPESLELAQFIEKLLRSPRNAEALRWLSASRAGQRRAIGVFRGAKPSVTLVKELYAAGATKVIAADIKPNPAGDQRSVKIVVVLPSCPDQRAAIFHWCKRQGEKIGYVPDLDGGEPRMYIYLG